MEDHEEDNFESLNKNEEQTEAPKPEAEEGAEEKGSEEKAEEKTSEAEEKVPEEKSKEEKSEEKAPEEEVKKPEEKADEPEKKSEDKEEIKKALESEKPVEVAPVVVTESIVSSEKYEKKKTGEFPKIMAAFFFLATAGLGGFLVYHYMTYNHNPEPPKEKEETVVEKKEETVEKKEEGGKTITSTTVVNTMTSSDENDAAVRAVIDKILASIDSAVKSKYNKNYYVPLEKHYDSALPYIKLDEAKVALLAQKSYGLYISAENLNIKYANDVEFVKTLNSASRTKLTELGFSKDGAIEGPYYLIGGDHYTNSQTGITCRVSADGSLPYGLSCSHKSWISSETIAMANKLAEAFKDKKGSYPFSIGASSYTITDSEVEPYQVLMTSIENGGGLWYRVNKDSDWVFFTSGQAAFGCSEANTKDLRNAFAGESCFTDDMQTLDTVKPWEE